MKRELKAPEELREALSDDGNSSIPYEEGTERDGADGPALRLRRGNSSIPYEEGTESRQNAPGRGLPGYRVTAAFPMKRELKVRLGKTIEKLRAG